MHGWAYSLFPRYTHTHTRTRKLGLTFPGRSTQVSLQIPLLLELTLESELLFWAHIHPLLLQKGTTDKKHVITEVLMHMKVRRCCRNHRVSPHNWVQLLYQIEIKERKQPNCFWLFPATSHQPPGSRSWFLLLIAVQHNPEKCHISHWIAENASQRTNFSLHAD